MEHADGGDLQSKIQEHQRRQSFFSETEIWHLATQLLQGCKALHDLKVCHRDIKSANIFLTKSGTVKLGDFNVSKVAKGGMLRTQTGTPYYASPEVWKDRPYDSRSDVWSIGCVIYEMCALRPPFKAQDMNGLYKRVCQGDYPPIPARFSSDLTNLLKTILKVDINIRPTCDQLLNMPFIKSKV